MCINSELESRALAMRSSNRHSIWTIHITHRLHTIGLKIQKKKMEFSLPIHSSEWKSAGNFNFHAKNWWCPYHWRPLHHSLGCLIRTQRSLISFIRVPLDGNGFFWFRKEWIVCDRRAENIVLLILFWYISDASLYIYSLIRLWHFINWFFFSSLFHSHFSIYSSVITYINQLCEWKSTKIYEWFYFGEFKEKIIQKKKILINSSVPSKYTRLKKSLVIFLSLWPKIE